MLTVAVPEPANVFLLEEIERLSGYQVQVVAATVRDIKATLQTYLPNDKVFVIDDIIEEVKPEEFTLIEAKVQDIANLEAGAGDSPVIKLVNYCIYNAVKDGASDIHIEPGDNGAARPLPHRRPADRKAPPAVPDARGRRLAASRSWPAWTSPSAACRRTAAST